MYEIEFKADVFYVGRIKGPRFSQSVVDFSVYVRLNDEDIDLTSQLTTDQLRIAKVDFIDRYLDEQHAERRSEMTEAELESERLMEEAEVKLDMMKHGDL